MNNNLIQSIPTPPSTGTSVTGFVQTQPQEKSVKIIWVKGGYIIESGYGYQDKMVATSIDEIARLLKDLFSLPTTTGTVTTHYKGDPTWTYYPSNS